MWQVLFSDNIFIQAIHNFIVLFFFFFNFHWCPYPTLRTTVWCVKLTNANILVCNVSQRDFTVVDTDMTDVWNQMSPLMLSWWHVAFPQEKHLSSVLLMWRADTWSWLMSECFIFFMTRISHQSSTKHKIIRSQLYAHLKSFSAFSLSRKKINNISILSLFEVFHKFVLLVKNNSSSSFGMD